MRQKWIDDHWNFCQSSSNDHKQFIHVFLTDSRGQFVGKNCKHFQKD